MNNKFFEYGIGAIDQNGVALPSSEALYGPYTSIDSAWTAIEGQGFDQVPIGLTVGIKNGNNIVEYWLNGGSTKSYLVQKNATVDVNSAISAALDSYYTKSEVDSAFAAKSDLNNKIYDLNFNSTNTTASEVALDWKRGSGTSEFLHIPAATTTKAGAMTAADRSLLNAFSESSALLMKKVTQTEYNNMKEAGSTNNSVLYVIVG